MTCGDVHSMFDPFCDNCDIENEDRTTIQSGVPLDNLPRWLVIDAYIQGFQSTRNNPFKAKTMDYKSYKMGQETRWRQE
tara:strand:+ start:986 stop:1222 length:237 start_codon:yes stop_codon:yes gene_type:complete